MMRLEEMRMDRVPREELEHYFSSGYNGAQTHVHEFLGSTMLAEGHNHRFAGVSSEKIKYGNSHIHAILTNTSQDDEHHHEVGLFSGPAIYVGSGRHVHFAYGVTTFNDGHDHNFVFATLIENSLDKELYNQ